VAKAKTWPDNPRALSGRLRRAATCLRKTGIEIVFKKEGRTRTRTISITRTPSPVAAERPGKFASAPSASSGPTQKSNPANGFAEQSPRTVAQDADGSGNGNASTVRDNPLENNVADGADGADANPRPQSGPEKTETPGWSARL
jgi:hypothetical protein